MHIMKASTLLISVLGIAAFAGCEKQPTTTSTNTPPTATTNHNPPQDPAAPAPPPRPGRGPIPPPTLRVARPTAAGPAPPLIEVTTSRP